MALYPCTRSLAVQDLVEPPSLTRKRPLPSQKGELTAICYPGNVGKLVCVQSGSLK